MNCLNCGHNNPGTVAFCQSCGGKLNLTADEIQESLAGKAKRETADRTEFYAYRLMIFGIVFFVLSMTVWVLSGGAPKDVTFVPSISEGAEHLQFLPEYDPQVEPLKVPLEE